MVPLLIFAFGLAIFVYRRQLATWGSDVIRSRFDSSAAARQRAFMFGLVGIGWMIGGVIALIMALE
jgi:hypothetical protein